MLTLKKGAWFALLLGTALAVAEDCNDFGDKLGKAIEDKAIDAAEKYAEKKYNVKGLVAPIAGVARDLAHAKNDYQQWDAWIDYYWNFTKNVLDYVDPGLKASFKNIPRALNGDKPDAGTSGGCGGKGPKDAAKASEGAGRRIDPLVLDLSGKGIKFIDVNRSKAFFDLNGNHFASRTAWIEPGAAFLAIDENEDGIINGISELIGNDTEEGFVQLAKFDLNNDGKISAEEIEAAGLVLWMDNNADGMTQPGEIVSLAEKGITELGLSPQRMSHTESDVRLLARSYFVRNGVKGDLFEIDFLTLPAYSRYVGGLDSAAPAVSMQKRLVPVDNGADLNLRGYGVVPELALVIKEKPALAGQVREVFAERDPQRMLDQFQALLFAWANVGEVSLKDLDPTPQSNIRSDENSVTFPLAKVTLTLKQLAFLKKYAGLKTLKLGDGAWIKEGQTQYTGALYRDAWNEIFRNLLAKFAVRSGYFTGSPYLFRYAVDSDYLYAADANNPEWNRKVMEDLLSGNPELIQRGLIAQLVLSEITRVSQREFTKRLVAVVQKRGVTALSRELTNPLLSQLAAVRVGTIADDVMEGGQGDDILLGGAGNDRLVGHSGDDILAGGDGSDTLEGGSGNDILNGGPGNDVLTGGPGIDTFVFELGNDVDVVTDTCKAKESDRIRLGMGLDRLRVVPVFRDLRIEVLGTNDVMILKDCFSYDTNVQTMAFETNDGKSLTFGEFVRAIPQRFLDGDNAELFRVIQERDLPKAEIYVAGGMNVNLPDSAGRTPLHSAVTQNSLALVELLLRVPRIDVNAKDSYGSTALHGAADGNPEILKRLLAQPGIQVNLAKNDGRTPLHIAAAQESPANVEALLEKISVNLNAEERNGDTALHVAAQNGRTDNVIRLALAKGMQLRKENEYHRSAFDVASGAKTKQVLQFLGGAPNPLWTKTVQVMATIHAYFENKGREVMRNRL